MERKQKIIMVDWGIVCHRAIYGSRFNPNIPVDYTALSMVLGYLFKVGVGETDKIIITADGRQSWRKAYDTTYKSGRKAQRESHEDINWEVMFGKMNRLLETIDRVTDWFVVKTHSFEADDWFAVAARYYTDCEVVVVSYDSDLQQLLVYPNVKIFSPLTKKYKFCKNPYQLIAKKIEKEVSDGLINPVLNEADYDKRLLLVDLLTLPDFVETPILESLQNLPEFKDSNPGQVPYDTLRERYQRVRTDKSKIVPYKEPVKKERKKKKCIKSETK